MLRIPRWTLVLSVALLATSLASVSLAQQQPQGGRRGAQGRPRMGMMGGPGMGGGGGLLGLMQIEQVKKELKLGEEQVNQINDLNQDLRSLMPQEPGAWRDMSQEDRQARFEEMRKKTQEIEKQLEDVLEPEQLKRLKQIALQMRLNMQGAGVLGDPEMVKALGISEGQVERLRALGEELRGQRPGRQGGQNREDWQNMTEEQRRARMEEMRQTMEKARKEAMDKALEVLTPDQKAKLEEMKGPEFKLDMSQVMRGRFGPGQGPGQRGPRGQRGPGGPGGQSTI